MYDVAICDDEMESRKILKRDICENEKYKGLLRIHEYDSGEALLKAMQEISFSIIFMDIQMDDMDGEQTAEEIRKLDDSVVLVFCTGYAEPTIHSIEVQPYRFIKKNMTDGERKKYIEDSLERMAAVAQIPVIPAKVDKTRIMLRPDDIIYIEKYKKFLKVHLSPAAQKRYQILTEEESDVRIYERLGNLYASLKSYGFGYPHNSYIINFQYLTSCTSEELQMEGFLDIVFKISRGKSVEFNDAKRMFLGSKYSNRMKK
ncbi:MAG: LytTR family DNA-binding domain-containing protein [Clostridium sp.]|nr:LytTR family DNA-binding domain-containing protein [Clostridium sp.]